MIVASPFGAIRLAESPLMQRAKQNSTSNDSPRSCPTKRMAFQFHRTVTREDGVHLDHAPCIFCPSPLAQVNFG
jgi:hypothetical protein